MAIFNCTLNYIIYSIIGNNKYKERGVIMRATDEYIRKARNEFARESFRNKLRDKLGVKCYNCGSKEHIEYHHIVPVVYGGTNKLSNIVPLCVSCHYKAHNKTNAEGIEIAKKNKKVGRKHTIPYETCYPYIEDYIYGKIGKKEFKSKCGYSEKYKLDKCAYIERYKKENDIHSFKNIIDVIMANGKLEENRFVGYIEFNNGKRLKLHYY
jgi:hypothetical protein